MTRPMRIRGRRHATKRTAFAALFAVAVCGVVAIPAAAQEVENTSYALADGARVLQHRVVVAASLEDVWAAFSTTEGLRAWAVPVAHVDFRVGGIWESSYDVAARIGDAGNIRNRYLAYLPMRMIAVQAEAAPPDFPAPELLPELFSVFEFEELGPRAVRVTVSGVGYRDDPRFEAVYALFDAGNAWSLRQLHSRFENGPVDWARVLGGGH